MSDKLPQSERDAGLEELGTQVSVTSESEPQHSSARREPSPSTRRAESAAQQRERERLQAQEASRKALADRIAGAFAAWESPAVAAPPPPPTPKATRVTARAREAWGAKQAELAARFGFAPDTSESVSPADLRSALELEQPRRVSVGAAEPLHADVDAAELAELEQRERVDAAELHERAREAVAAELGRWTKDSAQRLERLEPVDPQERRDAARVSRRVWAVSRLACCGAQIDLAYAASCMQADVGVEAFGAFVIEAMGLQRGGGARRPLFSPKARRKLVRSYVLYTCGVNGRLCDFAGSPSKLPVRGVKRLPQRLLARITAIGGHIWHRSTTTRDANESHAAGLFRRVRLPVHHADPSERNGKSGQVVSRYFMKRPTIVARYRSSKVHALGAVIGKLGDGGTELEAQREWLRATTRDALRLAVQAVPLVRSCMAFPAWVTGILEPLAAAPS